MGGFGALEGPGMRGAHRIAVGSDPFCTLWFRCRKTGTSFLINPNQCEVAQDARPSA